MAISFNGTSDTVVVANNSGLQPTGFTIAAWFYLNSTGASMAIATKNYAAAPWTSPYASWLVRFDFPNKIEFGTAQGGTYSALLSTVAILPQTWYHMACVYDGAHKICYFNGTVANSVISSAAMSYSTQELSIGSDHGAAPYGDLWSGQLEDVRYYNRALSSDEILNLAKSKEKYSDDTAGLIGYWPLDDAGLGSSLVNHVVLDRTQNGNHGTGIGGGLNGQPTQILTYKQGVV